jgi:hypothetical protein
MAAVASQDHEERFHNHYILRKRETLEFLVDPFQGTAKQRTHNGVHSSGGA